MKIKHTISILASLILLVLSGCNQERFNTPDGLGEKGINELRLVAHAPTNDPSLRAELFESEGTLDLQVRFRANDKVSLYAVQDGIITEIGAIKFKNLAEDGTKATIDFKLPDKVDATKPMTLIGYSGLNQTRITLVDNKLEVIADSHNTNSRDRFNAPVIFRLEDFSAKEGRISDQDVKFQHLGCYEIIHLTNKTDKDLTPSYLGLTTSNAYSLSRPWSYEQVYDTEVDKRLYPYYNLVDGKVAMKEEASRGDYTIYSTPIAPDATGSVFSWFIPRDVPRPEMVLNMRSCKTGDNIKSKELITAGTKAMEVGKAYHAWGTWDGTTLSLTNSKGEPKDTPYIKVTTEIAPKGFIEVKAYVSYSNRRQAFVDLNGNGIHDGVTEDCPNSSWKTVPYMVEQPEITFYGKFETLILPKQKITSVELSPVAMPGELNLKDNNLSTEALNELFEQLPDVNHIETSMFFTKKLSVDGNPGASKCNAQIAIDKGWILDLFFVDESKPYIYLLMSGYTKNHDLYLTVDAAPEDRDEVWIDLNGNASMDEGEKIETFGKLFKIAWNKDEIALYGKITKLNLAENGTIFALLNGTNTTLTYLDVANNGIAGIKLGNATNLEYLNISGNQLRTDVLPFDISKLTKLKSISAANCGLRSLNVSQMTQLGFINVEGNQLSQLSLSGKPSLRTVIATSNQLKTLTIDSKVISHLELGGNALSANALNDIITALPDRTKEKTPGGLWIAQNPGTAGAKIKAALDKRWNIDTKNLKADTTVNRGDMEGEDW